MLILLFFPNDHLVWAARMPPTPVAGLLRRIRSGAWTFPPAWRERLGESFYLPDPLPLRARAHGSLLIVVPAVPLIQKEKVVPDGDLRDLLARLKSIGFSKSLVLPSGFEGLRGSSGRHKPY